jgi:hypothetical protein
MHNHHRRKKKRSDQKQLKPGIYNWPYPEHTQKRKHRTQGCEKRSLCTVWLGDFFVPIPSAFCLLSNNKPEQNLLSKEVVKLP